MKLAFILSFILLFSANLFAEENKNLKIEGIVVRAPGSEQMVQVESTLKKSDVEKIRELRKHVQKILITNKF
ncbi:MAG: hypothetical protein ACOYL6_15665 [Bacteriovoracaceae bacterium]